MINKTFTVKRLFKEDIPMIEKCCADFDFLHFNPMTKDNILPMLIQGQIWAVFDGETTAAVCWMISADKKIFSQLNRAWEIGDLLNSDLSDCMVAGYVWIAKEYRKYPVMTALAKVWDIYRAKSSKKRVLHYVPAHIDFNMGEVLDAGFLLCGLRGLDKLVPHYIFVKDVRFENSGYVIKDEKICPAEDTKQISKLCEHGYCGYTAEGQNIKFTYRR